MMVVLVEGEKLLGACFPGVRDGSIDLAEPAAPPDPTNSRQ